MRLLLTISLALWLGAAQAESIRILVQSSPLATTCDPIPTACSMNARSSHAGRQCER